MEDAFHLIKQMAARIDELEKRNAILEESNYNFQTTNTNLLLINERLRAPAESNPQTASEGEEHPSKRLREDSPQLFNEQSVFSRSFIGDNEWFYDPLKETVGLLDDYYTVDNNGQPLDNNGQPLDNNGQPLDN